jgi:hypothetical protein
MSIRSKRERSVLLAGKDRSQVQSIRTSHLWPVANASQHSKLDRRRHNLWSRKIANFQIR